MRIRLVGAMSAAALAVALPVAITQAAPPAAADSHAVKKKVEVAFALDVRGIDVAPVEGQEGTYTLTQRLWSKKQRVHWFTPGPPALIGSMPVTRFAALLARYATADGATAPVVHIAYVQGAQAKDFLATVSVGATGLGATTAPTHTVTLSPISQQRLQQLAAGRGLLAKIAARCLTEACDAASGTREAHQKPDLVGPGIGNCVGQPKSCIGHEFYLSMLPRFADDPGGFPVGPAGGMLGTARADN